ncbi:MAG: SDR family oxidoreductase [Leptospiraceae bacterium]|nr:SDR family oxidoreductase [Leptospiraceae bacterium]
MNLFSVKDKTVLITGASRGIGRALAEGFADAGAIVYGTGTRSESIAWTAGSAIKGLVVDLRSESAMKDAMAAIHQEHGRLDCLLNNAAMALDVPASAIKEADLDSLVDTNFKGLFRACQAYYKLQRKEGGNIINVASVVGLVGGYLMSAYAGTKGAVIQISKSLALEWARSGFRVNALCPGFTETDMTAKIRQNSDYSDKLIESIPLRRMARPDEMLGPAIFLASEASSYITGTSIVVDGGVSRH